MIALLCFFLTLLASLFKSKSRLEAENAALRHQLIVLRRKVRDCVHLTNGDRLFLVGAVSMVPIDPEGHHHRPTEGPCTHRAGFRRYWRWKLLGTTGANLMYAGYPYGCPKTCCDNVANATMQ
jgi:hypothetical protein